jgi:hypothetical protein
MLSNFKVSRVKKNYENPNKLLLNIAALQEHYQGLILDPLNIKFCDLDGYVAEVLESDISKIQQICQEQAGKMYFSPESTDALEQGLLRAGIQIPPSTTDEPRLQTLCNLVLRGQHSITTNSLTQRPDGTIWIDHLSYAHIHSIEGYLNMGREALATSSDPDAMSPVNTRPSGQLPLAGITTDAAVSNLQTGTSALNQQFSVPQQPSSETSPQQPQHPSSGPLSATTGSSGNILQQPHSQFSTPGGAADTTIDSFQTSPPVNFTTPTTQLFAQPLGVTANQQQRLIPNTYLQFLMRKSIDSVSGWGTMCLTKNAKQVELQRLLSSGNEDGFKQFMVHLCTPRKESGWFGKPYGFTASATAFWDLIEKQSNATVKQALKEGLLHACGKPLTTPLNNQEEFSAFAQSCRQPSPAVPNLSNPG